RLYRGGWLRGQIPDDVTDPARLPFPSRAPGPARARRAARQAGRRRALARPMETRAGGGGPQPDRLRAGALRDAGRALVARGAGARSVDAVRGADRRPPAG